MGNWLTEVEEATDLKVLDYNRRDFDLATIGRNGSGATSAERTRMLEAGGSPKWRMSKHNRERRTHVLSKNNTVNGVGVPGMDTKLSSEIAEAIIDYILDGVTLTTAAASVGIARKTLSRWLEKGEKEDAREPYRTFATMVRMARAQLVGGMSIKIVDQAETNWVAGVTYLERTDPANFARQKLEDNPDRSISVVINLQPHPPKIEDGNTITIRVPDIEGVSSPA